MKKYVKNAVKSTLSKPMRGKYRRFISIGVSALLAVSTFLAVIPQMSVPVYATGTGKNLQLGASALAPVMTSVQEQGYDPDEKYRVTTAQTVYYGSSGTQKWYVIGCNGNGAVQMADTVTLFAENNLATGQPYHNPENPDDRSNHYNGSHIKPVVDRYYDYILFTGDEKAHIAERSLAHGAYSSNPGSFCDGISDTSPVNAYLWLLSTKEADLVGQAYREANADWWLRSPGNGDIAAAYVGISGNVYCYGLGVSIDEGVRPAFNLNLSSIIFTSAAESGKSSGTTGAGALTAPDNYTESEWKLTVNDTSRSGFAVNRLGSGKIAAGGNMRFNYSGAKKADNEYVSAILLDGSDSLLAYGRIVNTSSSTSGTSYITLPSTLVTDGNTYTLQFISEQYHTDKSTDYSSLPSSNSITFTAGKGTPTAVDFNVELPTDTTYDGSQKSATVTAKTGVSGMGDITVKYKDANDNVSTTAPTDLGTYQVLLDVAAGTYYDAADNITDDDWTFTISTAGTVATPTFSPAAGTYSTAQNVTISCTTAGATIHYTTDGTAPTAASSTYNGPINVRGTTTIKAIAVKDGMTNSSVASATYTISDTPIAVTGVSVAPTEVTLKPDATKKLTATVKPDNASNKDVTWESDDENIAAVSDDGTVTAKAEGETTITVKTVDGNKTATCKVIVKKDAPVVETCNISFDANGGKGEMDDQTVDKGVKTQLNANTFTRDGYTFDSWNTQADGKGKSYDDKDYITVEKDITLYAQWEKGKPRPTPRKHDDDEEEIVEESKPAVVNPDTVEGYFATNGQLLPGVTMGKTKQGVAAQAIFNASRPAGWQEAFSFNMAINGKVDYTLKNGVLTIIIPKEFQKAGRTFAIMALDKNGKAWTFADTDTNPSTVTAAINVEGYAFALIYKD